MIVRIGIKEVTFESEEFRGSWFSQCATNRMINRPAVKIEAINFFGSIIKYILNGDHDGDGEIWDIQSSSVGGLIGMLADSIEPTCSVSI